MTGFYIGMLAFALWVGVMIGIYRAVKANPGHPFWSMARFKIARQSIAPDLTPPVSSDPLELAAPTSQRIDLVHFDLPDVDPEKTTDDRRPTDSLIALDDSQEEEMKEVEVLLTSISAPKKPRPPRPPRKRHSGPIRSGRLTYILVDDEGRPEL